jgi:hypothetical protein
MTTIEVRDFIENILHQNSVMYYRIIGEMYCNTLGITQYGELELRINKKKYQFEWFNDDWKIYQCKLNLDRITIDNYIFKH